MNSLTNLITGLQSLFTKKQVDRDLDDELNSYLEASAAHKQRSGLSPEAASRAARAEIGSRGAVKHQVWSSRWESALDNLLNDIRFAFRQLLKTPGFTLIALLSLALGIGANTAIFTLFNAVLLRPLPVPQPQQLMLFGQAKWVGSTGGLPSSSMDLFSNLFYRAFSAQQSPFSGVTAISSIQMGSHLSINGGPIEHIHIDLVSGNHFDVLGVTPALGRVLTTSDDQAPGSNPVAVASFAWFQRHFQGNLAALGQSLRIQGHNYTLIGVAKPGFEGISPGAPADLWIPLSMEKEISPGWNGLSDHDFQSLYLIGRLKPGVTPAQASTSTNLLFQQIIRSEYFGDHPSPAGLADLRRARIDLNPIPGGLPGLRIRFSGPLTILMAIVLLVLLIACANIANMLLARGVARTREVAVRQALGATRSRIVTQFLTESLLLALAGAALGILLAWRGSRLLLALASGGPEAIPLDLSPDYRVLAFTLLVTILTALLFGIAPALRATRLELTPALKEGRCSSTASTRSRLARSLIVGQIALSILLLATAGLFLHSLLNLTRVDVGFNPQNVLVFSLDEYTANLPLDATLTRLQQQIEQSVQAMPDVHTAGFSMFTFNQGEWSDSLMMQSIPRTPENGEEALYNVIGNQYLQAVGIPLLAGRGFNSQDTATSPHVAIVNETLARRFFPNGSALGHRFCVCDGDPAHGPAGPFDIEIVGVARDAHYISLDENQHMTAYFPYSQRIQYFGNLSVRYSGPAAPLIPAVRRAIAQVNPDIAIGQVETLNDKIEGSIATQRLIGLLSAFFAVLAVLLAAIGIYGLMNLTVSRRTNEIGIRLALGAQTRTLIWLILRESLTLLALGLIIGLPIALTTIRSLAVVLKHQLFNTSTLDPITFLIAIAAISAMTLLAAWLPARRAATVDPMAALRCD